MNAVLLVIQVLLAAGLVATILMQRSEGGALGIGGGGPGGAMGARGAENLLTRATMILGAAFIANSILLAVLASVSSDNQSVIDRAGGAQSDSSDFPITFDDAPTPDAEATAEDEPAADDEPASQDEPDIPGR